MGGYDPLEYLQAVARRLEESGGLFVAGPLLYQSEDGGTATLRASLRFHDGSLLRIALTVSATADYPAWVSYRFHYQGPDGRCRFRYDNTPHHPGLPHFPHHKHEGPEESPVPHSQPSVAQVLREVAVYLGRPPG